MATQLKLSNSQAPGDLLMMTCAVRDLHRTYPGEFVTEIETTAPAIWENNPNLGFINWAEPVHELKLGYSAAINQCNQRMGHFATGFGVELSKYIHKPIRPGPMRADLYMTEEERDPERRIIARPYWLVVAGGKDDMTAKIWDHAYWQQTVDKLRPDTYMVQVGSAKHRHAPVRGAQNLLGRTTLRELINLVYHAEGAICPITCVMHLCAAFNKPCVVIAGGREPWWWEAYTRTNWAGNTPDPVPDDLVSHAFIHTMHSTLSCCRETGCWRSGVGEKKMGKNCRRVEYGPTMKQPACLKAITPDMVVGAVRRYQSGEPVPEDALPARDRPLWQLDLPERGPAYGHIPKRSYGPRRRGERRQAPTEPVVIRTNWAEAVAP